MPPNFAYNNEMIDELTIRRIKDAANVYDVIGDYFQLKKVGSGRRYQCLCPFHDDRHLGSFVVDANKNNYHCYACGAWGDSITFLMEHERLSFPDALRWLGQKYGIEVDDEQKRFKAVKTSPKNLPPADTDDLPIMVLPASMAKNTMKTEHDPLCQWLRTIPWAEDQKERIDAILRNYIVGHSDVFAKGEKIPDDQPTFTIFWYMDDELQLRTGKMLRYHSDTGKRYKKEELAYNTDWIHSRMFRTGRISAEKFRAEQCLFGLHLVNMYPKATINIVESEKTAIICSIAYGHQSEQLWMACGGLNNITQKMLQPLINRNLFINLYPDHDGINAWIDAAHQIKYDRLHVNTQDVTRLWQPADGQKADIADILLRIIRNHSSLPTHPTNTLDAMVAENPQLQTLIDTFNLIEIK